MAEELESRFVYICPKSWFENCKVYHNDVVVYYSCGARLSQRKVELKTNQSKEMGVLFYKNRLWPLIRTKSIEMKTKLSSASIIETIIHRKIVGLNEYWRESIEQHENQYGVQYFYVAEIEYANIENRKMKEMEMIDKLQYEINLDLELSEVFACVGIKVQTWDRFNSNAPYKWAFKWDGIKCKFLINSLSTFLWPDLQEVKMYNSPDLPKIMTSILWNAELLTDKLVLFDALSIKYNGNLYFFDTETSIELLKFFNLIVGNFNLDQIKVQFQKFYDKIYTDDLGMKFKGFPMWSSDQDGIIIFQNEKIIKWKVPTIDMKCIGTNKFSVAGKVLNVEYPNAKVGKIYEFSPSPKGLILLRLRNDRIAASTENELEVYQNACSMMSGQILEPLL
jgi:hypothetical protein